jgi:hypothetical protein
MSYEYEPKSNSPYLRLKSKGDQVKIRLVSDPINFLEDYKGESQERFAWIVIDRADETIKGFKSGVMIYKAIKRYAQDEDWGDPTKYDFTIVRTEEQGSYYTVTPSPKMSSITAEEKTKIEESGIDLVALFKVEEMSIDELPPELEGTDIGEIDMEEEDK